MFSTKFEQQGTSRSMYQNPAETDQAFPDHTQRLPDILNMPKDLRYT
jgi:hypothetical protein